MKKVKHKIVVLAIASTKLGRRGRGEWEWEWEWEGEWEGQKGAGQLSAKSNEKRPGDRSSFWRSGHRVDKVGIGAGRGKGGRVESGAYL